LEKEKQIAQLILSDFVSSGLIRVSDLKGGIKNNEQHE
jgi:hypothetical protein